jgi:hypothetical protein
MNMSGLDFRKAQLSKMGQNASCGRRVPVLELMRCVRMADGLNMTERSELASLGSSECVDSLRWVLIVLSFFVLSVQLFVIIIGFMLTTLAGLLATCRWTWARALGDDGDRGGRAVVAVVGIGRRATDGGIVVNYPPVWSPRIDPGHDSNGRGTRAGH